MHESTHWILLNNKAEKETLFKLQLLCYENKFSKKIILVSKEKDSLMYFFYWNFHCQTGLDFVCLWLLWQEPTSPGVSNQMYSMNSKNKKIKIPKWIIKKITFFVSDWSYCRPTTFAIGHSKIESLERNFFEVFLFRFPLLRCYLRLSL